MGDRAVGGEKIGSDNISSSVFYGIGTPLSRGKIGGDDTGKTDYRNPGAVEKMKMREYNFYLFLKTSLHRNSKGFPLPSSLET